MGVQAVKFTTYQTRSINQLRAPIPNSRPHKVKQQTTLQSVLLLRKKIRRGQPGWLSRLAPPSAQGVILETWDRVPAWSLRLPLPVSLPLSLSLSLSLCVSLMNK